jgi:hypothetical protein
MIYTNTGMPLDEVLCDVIPCICDVCPLIVTSGLANIKFSGGRITATGRGANLIHGVSYIVKKGPAFQFWIHEHSMNNRSFALLRFRSALHCGYSGITDKDSGLEYFAVGYRAPDPSFF